MTREEMLEQVLQSAGIRHYRRWLQRELEQGRAEAGLELTLLFCAIHRQLLNRDSIALVDTIARGAARQSNQSSLDEAFCKVAASNCDRDALVQVIRHFQTDIACSFLAWHDGIRAVSPSAAGFRIRMACQNQGPAADTGLGEEAGQLWPLPDDLHTLFEDFLSDIEPAAAADAD